jgi:hypothetical protein
VLAQAEAEAEAENKTIGQPTDVFALQIYEAYPRKVAKKAALKSIKSALKAVSPEALLEKTVAYAKAVEGADMQFVPHPSTWFNQERYNDDPNTWNKSSGNGPKVSSSVQAIQDQKEYERVMVRMSVIRSQYGDHQDWDKKDREEFTKLKDRKAVLKERLGVAV